MDTNTWTALGTWVTAIATCSMAWIAFRQLSNLNKSLNDNNLMANFGIEFELNRRKERLADLRKEVQDFIDGKAESELTESEKTILKRMNGTYHEALENYLNAFDRLCYFIRKNMLHEEDFRTEYRDVLQRAVANFQAEFENGTKYHNMLELNKTWAEK